MVGGMLSESAFCMTWTPAWQCLYPWISCNISWPRHINYLDPYRVQSNQLTVSHPDPDIKLLLQWLLKAASRLKMVIGVWGHAQREANTFLGSISCTHDPCPWQYVQAHEDIQACQQIILQSVFLSPKAPTPNSRKGPRSLSQIQCYPLQLRDVSYLRTPLSPGLSMELFMRVGRWVYSPWFCCHSVSNMTSLTVGVIPGQATEAAVISMIQVRDEGPNLHWPQASGLKTGIVIGLHQWPDER